MIPQKFNAKEIRARLDELIVQADKIEPTLAKRLIDLRKWIKQKKDGCLNSKPYVLDLLAEVVLDSTFWLDLNPLNVTQRQFIYTEMNCSPAQQYWFDVLFPQWLNERDPKLPIWKQEVMAGNFNRDDEIIIRSISQKIEALGGSCLWNHILDLSMATDLVTTGIRKDPLCVQLTTVSGINLTQKHEKWQKTLIYWSIKRGLLISYNSMRSNHVAILADRILNCSDNLPTPCYTVKSGE